MREKQEEPKVMKMAGRFVEMKENGSFCPDKTCENGWTSPYWGDDIEQEGEKCGKKREERGVSLCVIDNTEE